MKCYIRCEMKERMISQKVNKTVKNSKKEWTKIKEKRERGKEDSEIVVTAAAGGVD